MMITVSNLKKLGYKGIKEYKNNKANWYLLLKKIPINLTSLNIWKTQKDYRLTAKKYLNTLNEKNFENDEDIKLKLINNKKYYFNKLERLNLKSKNKIMKLMVNLEILEESNDIKNKETKIINIENKINHIREMFKFNTENLIFAYHSMNYLIQHKPYLINQEIDKKVINFKNKKVEKHNQKINKLEKVISKLNTKLDLLVNPQVKTKKTKNNEIIEIVKAPVDLNKPTKQALNIINGINAYESKKQKVIDLKLNVEHHFDLIKQQWSRNKFHKLITNPYYKTNT